MNVVGPSPPPPLPSMVKITPSKGEYLNLLQYLLLLLLTSESGKIHAKF